MVKKGISKVRHYVTSQVAISRRVHRYKLALRDHHVTRGRREQERRGGGVLPIFGVGLAHGCRVGNYESWTEEGYSKYLEK